MPWIKCLGGGGGKARRGKPLSVSQPIHLLVKVSDFFLLIFHLFHGFSRNRATPFSCQASVQHLSGPRKIDVNAYDWLDTRAHGPVNSSLSIDFILLFFFFLPFHHSKGFWYTMFDFTSALQVYWHDYYWISLYTFDYLKPLIYLEY